MNIYDRDLVGVSGGDVRIAHGLLRRLGFAVSLTERTNETYGETTRNAVRRFQADNGLVASGSIDSPTYAALMRKADQTAVPDSYSVHGTVRDSDGTPRAGIWVRVVDVDFRGEQFLGEVKTDENGQYSIKFNASAFSKHELRGPDLLVRAFSFQRSATSDASAPRTTASAAAPLASSSIVFNADPDTTIDLLIGGGVFRGSSEFDRIQADLAVLVGSFPITQIGDQDLAFLAGETDYLIDWLRDFVIAARLSDQTASPPNPVSPTPITGNGTIRDFMRVNAQQELMTMKLKVRNLSIKMRGEDIALLQHELRQLGSKISEGEIERRLFGQETRNAMF